MSLLVVNQVFIRDHVHTKTRPVNPVGQAAGYNEQYTIAKYINNNNTSYSVTIYVITRSTGIERKGKGRCEKEKRRGKQKWYSHGRKSVIDSYCSGG